MREARSDGICFPDLTRNGPVLILTRDSAVEFLREVTVAPITSSITDAAKFTLCPGILDARNGSGPKT